MLLRSYSIFVANSTRTRITFVAETGWFAKFSSNNGDLLIMLPGWLTYSSNFSLKRRAALSLSRAS